MEKQTETTKTFKKVSVREIPTPDDKKGFEFEGTFVTVKKKPYQRVSKSGEVTDETFAQLILDIKGDRHAVACDGGLQEQLHMSDVKQGDYIKCVNLGKKPLKGGRSINIWDVFVAN